MTATTTINSGYVNSGITLNDATLTNISGGTVVGNAGGSGYAVYGVEPGNPDTVVNSGSIAGVRLNAGGGVTNTTGGVIQGTQAGVAISGAAGNVVNASDITGTGENSTGVLLISGGTVTNQTGGTIDGTLYGVQSSNIATVTNNGRIGVGASVGIGLSGGLITNVGTATIAGTSAGIRIYTGGTVVDAGTISGGADAVYFHSGFANRLVVDPGAVFSGALEGGNTLGATAVSVLELASGTSAGTLSGLGTTIVDFAQITIDSGATWTLTSDKLVSSSLSAGYAIYDNGTLTNTGTLSNADTLGPMVQLGPGAELINAQGATIIGYPAAVYSASGGSAGTVLNSGLLTSGSASGRNGGVVLFSGGYVSNAASGTISGGGVGVIIYNYANTLTNGGSVVNRGSISGFGTKASGVELDTGGFVSNAAGGTISGSHHGVQIHVASTAESALVVNQGFIYSATGNDGIYLQGGGTVSNTGTGTVLGADAGVDFGNGGAGSSATLFNTGYIAATGAGGTAVHFTLLGVATNAGTIGAVGATGDAVLFSGNYANRLVIDPGAVFRGTVDGGNQIGNSVASTLELASAATKGTLTGLGSTYINFAQVTIDTGATWNFSGSNTLAAQATLNNSGTLSVSGKLTDNGLLDGGGLLVIGGGAGSNGTLTVGAGGTIDLTSASQTTSNIILGNAVASGTLAAGQGSLVVSGAGALLETNAPIAVGRSLGATGVLAVTNGGSAFAETSNSNTSAAVAVGQFGNGTVVVDGAGSELTVDGLLYDGRAGTGTLLVQNDGSLVLNADDGGGNAAQLQIGVGNSGTLAQSGGSGTATVASGGVINSGSLIVIGGNNESGTLTVNGGTVEAATINIGVNTTIAGTVYGGAGILNIGTGGLVETLGTTTTTDTLFIGKGTLTSGAVTVSGGTLSTNGGIAVGSNGSGTLTVNAGGSVTVTGGLTIAQNAGSSGTLVVDGGMLTVSSPTSNNSVFNVGQGGFGTLTIEGGGTIVSTQTQGPAFDIGLGTSGGGGAATVTGANSLLQVNGQLNVGDREAGSLDINSGGVVEGSGQVALGVQAGGAGTITVEGGGTLTGGSVFVANSVTGGATGLLSVGAGGTAAVGSVSVGSGGTVAVAGSGALLSVSGATGGINVGGNSTGAALLNIGVGGVVNETGTLNVFGSLVGTIFTGGTVNTVSIGTPSGSATIDVSGGTLSAADGINVGANGTLLLSSGLVTATGTSGVAIDSSGTGESLIWVSGGTLLSGGGIDVGTGAPGSSGTLIVSGGLVENTGSFGVGVGPAAGGSGLLLINGGTLADPNGSFSVGSTNASATLVVDAGGLLLTGSSAAFTDIAAFGTGTALAIVSNGTWIAGNQIAVGNGGQGSLDINSNGLVNTGTNGFGISGLSGSNGTVSVENGGTLITGELSITNTISGSANGVLSVGAGGTVLAGGVSVNGGGTVTVGGAGAILTVDGSAGGISIGNNGSGAAVLNIDTGGVVNETGTLNVFGSMVGTFFTAGTVDTVSIGSSAGSATLSVNGGSLSAADGLDVSSSGTLTLSSGAITISGSNDLSIGSNGTGVALVAVSGGTLSSAGGIGIGTGATGGTGTLTVSGGLVENTGNNSVNVGFATGGSGLLLISGGTFADTTGYFGVGGPNASGTLQLDAGGLLITGSGTAFADINATGTGTALAIVSGGTWNSGDELIVGDAGTGTLDIDSGGVVNAGTNTVSIGNQNGGAGTISVSGAGATLDGGNLLIAAAGASTATGVLSIGAGGTVDVTSVAVGNGGSIALAGGLLDPTSVTVNTGGAVSGFGTLDASLNNGAMVTASGGLLDVTGAVSGSGTLAISAGATLMLAGTVFSSQIIDFSSGTGVLQLGTIGFGGTIDGIQSGDSIVLTDVTDATAANILAGNTLQIVRSGNPAINLQLDPSFNFGGDYFHIATAGGNATLTEDNSPCYLAGTLILTDRGEVLVETLRIGDHVVTRDGTAKPIKWIGRRSYAGAIPSGLRDVIPILIVAGALGDGLPKRDLIVSPLHAMYCDGVLVPAEHLVNGHSIRRAPEIDPIRYFHIELQEHDVIFAEGAPAETFVDCDSRSMFHNAAEFDALYPGAATPHWRFCAPRVEGGERLAAIKRAIDRRAGLELADPAAPPGRLEGRLDGVEGARISGWAYHPDRTAEPVWLEVLDGDGVIARVHARRYRADLEAAGVGDGRHGFELHLTGPMRTRREIRVRRVEDGLELNGSPLVIEPRAGDALVEDARRVIATAMLNASDDAALEALSAELLHGVDALRQARAGRAAPVERSRAARALIIDSHLPRPEHDAGSQAVLCHAAALAALGFQVEFVAAHELARAEAASVTLEAAGYVVHRAPAVASVEEVLRRHRNAFDVVYLHRLANAEAYAPLARTWQARARLLYCVADLHHVRLARQAAVQASEEVAAEARATQVREFNAMRLCDAVITHSTAEAAYLARVAPNAAVHVVPWTPHPQPRPVPFAARQGVAAIGSWSHEPNVDAVRWLVTDIMPRVWSTAPAIELMVVGSDWPTHVPWITDRRVRMVGAIGSLESLLAMLRVTVAPLRFGAGLKGKVLDSFASEVPCVMTPVAAEGFPLGGILRELVAEDADGLASLIVRLHQQPAFNRAAAADGLVMAARFSADAIRTAMTEALGGRSARLAARQAALAG